MNLTLSDGHGISERDLKIIAQILSPYTDRLDRVGLFGSRATGRFTQYSDIDLVVFGRMTQKEIFRIQSEFEDSGLSRSIDVCSFTLVDDDLQRHIVKVLKPLWQKDLADNYCDPTYPK